MVSRLLTIGFLIISLNALAVTDTLRNYNPASSTVNYNGYVTHTAYFALAAPCTLETVIVTLGGDTGTVTLHVFDHGGGSFAPELETDLITPIVVHKADTGRQSLTVTIPPTLYLSNNHLFVGITNISAGVTFMSDNEVKTPECSSTTGGTYYYQWLKNSTGTWDYGYRGFLVDMLVTIPNKVSPQYFKDVTLQAGIDTNINVRSIAWGDFNNDGQLDFLGNNRLFKNNGNGTFTKLTTFSNLAGGIQGVMFVDFDNDGLLDVVQVLSNDTIVLRKNNGDETFSQTTLATYLSGYAGWNGLNSMSIADINLDKYPDIFLGRLWSVYPVGGSPDAPPNKLLLNDKNFNLVDTTGMIYPANYPGHRSRASEWVDFDNDGDLDLYVANYYLERDEFWQNNGDGTFTNIIAAKGIDINATGSNHGTGVDWMDYDNDGDIDLLLSQFAHPRFVIPYDHRGTTIYRNEGAPNYDFTDLTSSDGIQYEETHTGGSWGDVNNDGLSDIFIEAYYGCRYTDLYLQKPDHSYEMKTFEYGFWNTVTNQDAAWVDYDNDGKLDLAASDEEGPLFRLYHNEAPTTGNFIEIDLKSTSANDFAIGGRVTVYSGGQVYMQEVTAGRGQKIQKPSRLHFGLGPSTTIDSVVVRWPNGSSTKERFTGLDVNRLYTLVEGGGILNTSVQNLNGLTLFTIYPNPVSDNLNIRFTTDKNSDISIEVTDILGKNLVSKTEKTTSGLNNYSIKTNSFSNGFYNVTITGNNIRKTERFIIAH